ncbi:MAG: hypothetical protein NVS9B10_22520 [Nevskia sp.]
MDDYSAWRSLRELDEAAGLPKGSAFRAFKAALAGLSEGRDFIVLDHQTQAALAAALHAQGRLYRSSVHPVLLAPAAAEALMRQLAAASKRS